MKDKELLKKIWDYCDDKQKQIMEEGEGENKFCQGEIIICRQIQYKINGKCTDLSKWFIDEMEL